MANRHTLSVNKLPDFKSWLSDNGWQIHETKGVWEVLRATKKGRKRPLILYQRAWNDNGTELVHLSVLDRDMGIVRGYLQSRRQAK